MHDVLKQLSSLVEKWAVSADGMIWKLLKVKWTPKHFFIRYDTHNDSDKSINDKYVYPKVDDKRNWEKINENATNVKSA